jgi:hypothetical protein
VLAPGVAVDCVAIDFESARSDRRERNLHEDICTGVKDFTEQKAMEKRDGQQSVPEEAPT